MRILGISPSHDSSIAIINNGELEYFSKEERISRVKRDKNPWSSLKKGLELIEGDIDFIAYSSPTFTDFEYINHSKFLSKTIGGKIINYCDKHHLSHAALAFNNCRFEEALTFVIDRDGSDHLELIRESETVFKCNREEGIKELHKNFWVKEKSRNGDEVLIKINNYLKDNFDFSFNINNQMSIVKVYESATTLIGQSPLENGKVMGLSSYGKDNVGVDLFYNGRPIDNLFIEGKFDNGGNGVLLHQHLNNIISNISKENYKPYADYAYQVQKQTQIQVLNLIKEWTKKTGINNVCLSGGYAFNVVANQFLIKNLPYINFYFEPSGDDSGNSIGAALHLYREISGDKSFKPITTQYLGKKYTEKEILEGIKKYI